MWLFRRIVNAFRRSKLEQDIDRELESHVEMRRADNIAAGMSPDQACRDARIRFGNRTLTRERVTAVDAELVFDSFARELRYAARQLRRSSAFALTALLTLSLGIGANVVVFSVLNALLLLAVTGVFGMAMYSVSKRMKEFGIRVAVGAQPVQLMRSALSRPILLLLLGSAAGLVLGAMASRLLAQIVYQATPRDPLVFAGVMITMAVLGLIATWLPAQRALDVHPAGLLREE